MSLKVQVKNFQIIKSVSLEFLPGFNVIVGPSNNGKTSIFKAVKSALFTIPGTTPIRIGEDSYIVGLEYLGHTLVYKKGMSNSVYIVDGETYSKFGTTTPPIIPETFNLKELVLNNNKEHLNFWDQMDYPFLLNRSGGDLFKFIVDSGENDQVSKALKSMVSDRQGLSREVDKLQGSIDLINIDIDKFETELKLSESKVAVCDKIINLKPKIDLYKALLSYSSKLKDNIVSVEKTDKNLKTILYKFKFLNKLNKLGIEYFKLANLKEKTLNVEFNISNNQMKINKNSIILSLGSIRFNTINDISNLLKYKQKIINSDTNIQIIESILVSKNKIIDLDRLDYSRLFMLNNLKDSLFVLNKKIIENKPSSVVIFSTKVEIFDLMNIYNYNNNLKLLLDKINNSSADLKKIEDKMLELQSIRGMFKVCPYCGSRLEECND